MTEKNSWILYLGTFPPRECGIATFTQDLTRIMDNLFAPAFKSKIMAMNNSATSTYNYPKDVIYQLIDDDITEYIEGAKKINKNSSIKLVNIQHEFGIFGGEYGCYLISFLEALQKPVIITFHTVLPDPDKKLRKIIRTLADKSAAIIVMTNKGVDILRKKYGIKSEIYNIPHGIPTIPFGDGKKEKKELNFHNKILLFSFGMMNPNKGYEFVIEALPKIVAKFPNVLYLIVGETHPVVRKNEGENYRNFLEKKIQKLDLKKYVKFYNKYVKLSEIVKYLQATDIYICSNLNPNQITSGTLAYAMGAGRPVISTPFLYAQDLVTPERGKLVKFNDSASITKALLEILSNTNLKQSMARNAYTFTRNMTWPNVALSYYEVFNKYLSKSGKYDKKTWPKFKLNHLLKMTDDFSIIQFSNNLVPDKSTGYTLDDNARAMIVVCQYFNIFKDNTKLDLIEKYLNFIEYVQQPDGKLFGFVDIKKNINLDHWTEDAHGRAVWSLGYLLSIKNIPKKLRNKALKILDHALKITDEIKSPRAVAYIIIGLYYYCKYNNKCDKIDTIRNLADHLCSLYNDHATKDWQWFENFLTYANSRLPGAILLTYEITQDKKYLEIGKKTLEFLINTTFKNDTYAPIGHDGWYFKDGHRAHYDQQPIDTATMVQTLLMANQIIGNEKYFDLAKIAFSWFLGNNSLKQMVYDESSGGCHDGVGQFSINLNQGAESTLSYLMARLSFEE